MHNSLGHRPNCGDGAASQGPALFSVVGYTSCRFQCIPSMVHRSFPSLCDRMLICICQDPACSSHTGVSAKNSRRQQISIVLHSCGTDGVIHQLPSAAYPMSRQCIYNFHTGPRDTILYLLIASALAAKTRFLAIHRIPQANMGGFVASLALLLGVASALPAPSSTRPP